MPVNEYPCGDAVHAHQHMRWQAMSAADLEKVMVLEQASHSHPWSQGNFRDSLQTPGFYLPMLLKDQRLLGYLVAMAGFEEAHLLNITVDPLLRGKGFGQCLMQVLDVWAVQHGAQQIWLEVRQSNTNAQGLYRKMGYEQVAIRKDYYPLNAQQKEHAVVMRKVLQAQAL
ncbi:ribosomal-protein-alanine N-acetyltransferase [Lampropedia puyangensis]|uniref:[Ribosomal protein bS18]-alanine N-acetyltransferase n=1 Tax=Lampropedia puyangensis TaxID=1330072 RepID=A0A4S8F5U5_9BURK|nr:ribosomal protein S18-alanine N-acetyltransferase [Lampropedia puyangensis]THU01524.1 ribosomal-protein-alanine N-acetyltransferase [Lampropedia puyangensis]